MTTQIQEARIKKTLNTYVSYSNFGGMTRREFIERVKGEGWTTETAQRRNTSKEQKEREDLESLARYMPFGNPAHPQCRDHASRKAALAEGFFSPEYRVVSPDGSFYVITKIEYDYYDTLAEI